MKLILLGTGGYHPNEHRHTACMLLPECGVMLDAGTAAFRAGNYLTMRELDVFLTHAHLDHTSGLTYLIDITRAFPLDRITVHGAADKLAAVQEHLFAELLFPAPPLCRFEPLEGEVALAGSGRLAHFPLRHRGGALGFRLDWPGHSLAYVTDTTASPDSDYVELIRGVDLLLHECYFPDRYAQRAEETGHSHASAVADLARRAEVGRLALVHFDPARDEADPIDVSAARAIFPKTEVGEDRMELEF